MLVHPDGAAEHLQATPQVPPQRLGSSDSSPAPRARHAAPDPATAEYPSFPPTGRLRTSAATPTGAPPTGHPPVPTGPPGGPMAGPVTGTGEPGAVPTAGGAAAMRTPPQIQVIHSPRDVRHDETMVLPAFLTGQVEKKPEPEPAAPPGRPDPAAKLPATERGMLIFVAALLGIGTIAVVAMMGMGLTAPKSKHPPKGTTTATASTSPAAATVPSTTPSTVTDPTPSSSATTKPSGHPSSSGPMVLGSVAGKSTLTEYCAAGNAKLVGPVPDGSYRCVPDQGQIFVVSPNNVCRWRYRDNSAYSPSRSTDPLPWKCLT